VPPGKLKRQGKVYYFIELCKKMNNVVWTIATGFFFFLNLPFNLP